MRPWVSLVLASSLDGKLSPGRGERPGFPSKQDQAHLQHQVSLADAVLLGAGTIRAYSSAFLVKDPELLAARQGRGQTPQPLAVVASRNLNLDPNWNFFKQDLPRLLVTGQATPAQQASFAPTPVLVCGDAQGVDFGQLLHRLKAEQGIQRLALLGGGQIVAQFFALGLVDELWLTLCPVIVAGTDAPSVAEGLVLPTLVRGRLASLEQVADELFLRYLFDANQPVA